MKQKVDISLKNCEVIFEDNDIKLIEHTKDEDLEFRMEDILRKFEGQMFNMTLSTTNDI